VAYRGIFVLLVLPGFQNRFSELELGTKAQKPGMRGKQNRMARALQSGGLLMSTRG
jgi:hypothetical protein